MSSTRCYDRQPTPPRSPIAIAGELVRRGDKLSIEAAKSLKALSDLCQQSGEILAEQINSVADDDIEPRIIRDIRYWTGAE